MAPSEQHCEQCGATFQVEHYRLARGHGRFCSYDCANASRGKKRPPIDNGDGTATVPLTQGSVAIIDASDMDLVAGYSWGLVHGYAVSSIKSGLHRVIANAPDGLEVDHIDGDPLNNRRSNLRICSHAENVKNARRRKDNVSGFKGVHYSRRWGKYRATIKVNGVRIALGYFETPEEGARAYDEAARRYHGRFARTNFETGQTHD